MHVKLFYNSSSNFHLLLLVALFRFERFFSCMNICMYLKIQILITICCTHHICMPFLQCEHGNVSTDSHSKKTVSGKFYIYMAFLSYGPANASLNFHFLKTLYHILHICTASHQYGYVYEPEGLHLGKTASNKFRTCRVCHPCVYAYGL